MEVGVLSGHTILQQDTKSGGVMLVWSSDSVSEVRISIAIRAKWNKFFSKILLCNLFQVD